jgi:hypothetical protein
MLMLGTPNEVAGCGVARHLAPCRAAAVWLHKPTHDGPAHPVARGVGSFAGRRRRACPHFARRSTRNPMARAAWRCADRNRRACRRCARRAATGAEAAGSRRVMPARLHVVGLVLRPKRWGARRHTEAARSWRKLPMGAGPRAGPTACGAGCVEPGQTLGPAGCYSPGRDGSADAPVRPRAPEVLAPGHRQIIIAKRSKGAVAQVPVLRGARISLRSQS